MPRIITVTDEDLGVEARIHTDKTDTSGEVRITKLELLGLGGRGILSADLLILQDLGLPLPTPGMIAPPAKAVTPPQVEAKALDDPVEVAEKKTAIKKTSSKLSYRIGPSGRTYYDQPPVEELVALYAEMGNSPAKVAHHYGVKPQTVSNWLTRLRKEGYPFPHGNSVPQSS